MATLIICFVVMIIIGLIDDWYYLDDFLGYVFIIFSWGFFGAGIGFILMLALPADTKINTYTYKIEALQDNNSLSGDFFLGSGSVEGKMKYVFYYETDGGFKMAQVDYEDAIIKYSNEPKVIKHKEEHTDSFINWFAVDIFTITNYEIFIPKGAIKSNYNLDAQ